MRITGGSLAGRPLRAPAGEATRPMVGRIREALFNILAHRHWLGTDRNILIGARVLDAFCGTGAVAFEAISRGAAQATLFDLSDAALRAARENAAAFGVAEQCAVLRADALKPPPAPLPASLVFLCPPYHKGLTPKATAALVTAGWIGPQTLVVSHVGGKEDPEVAAEFETLQTRAYGDSRFDFYRLR